MSTRPNRHVAVLALAAVALSFAVTPAAAQRMSGGGGMRHSAGGAQGGQMRPAQAERSPQTYSREAPAYDRDHGRPDGEPSRWQHREPGRPDWGHDRGGYDGGRFGGYAQHDRGYPGYGHGWDRGRGYGPAAGFRGYGWNGFGLAAPGWGRGFAPAYRGWGRPAFGYAPVLVVPVYHGWAAVAYNVGPARRPEYRGWGHGDGGYRQPSPYRYGDHRE